MNKPKLLLVADTYHPQVDGIVVFIDEFIKRARERFQISLLVPKFKGSQEKKESQAFFLDTSKLFKPLPTYPSVKLSLKNLSRIKKAVKENDIIFLQGPSLGTLLAVHYAKKLKKKSLLYLHVLPWELFEKSKSWIVGRLAKLLKRIFISYYNQCDEILIPYHELNSELRKEGIKNKMTVARLGIDIDKFHPSPDKARSKQKVGLDKNKTVIGFVGRISREKNVHVLLEAFKKLKDQSDLILLIVGDGPKEQKKEMEELENCKITGFVHNVQDYLQAMDIFVLPSLTETTSLATLEAMSSGLPVIVTKVGFMSRYIIKNHNGVFFPRDNATILTIKLERLLKNQGIREKLGQNARRTVAYSFSWERSINKIKRVILELLYHS